MKQKKNLKRKLFIFLIGVVRAYLEFFNKKCDLVVGWHLADFRLWSNIASGASAQKTIPYAPLEGHLPD